MRTVILGVCQLACLDFRYRQTASREEQNGCSRTTSNYPARRDNAAFRAVADGDARRAEKCRRWSAPTLGCVSRYYLMLLFDSEPLAGLFQNVAATEGVVTVEHRKLPFA
jgi:hypothetical protein